YERTPDRLRVYRDDTSRGEEHYEGERAHSDTQERPAPALLAGLNDGVGVARGMETDVAQCLVGASRKDRKSDQHSDARRTEAPVPPYLLAQDTRDELSEKGADVDPHVEDREAGVATLATFRIQVTDDCRDVRLEQAGAEHDED